MVRITPCAVQLSNCFYFARDVLSMFRVRWADEITEQIILTCRVDSMLRQVEFLVTFSKCRKVFKNAQRECTLVNIVLF